MVGEIHSSEEYEKLTPEERQAKKEAHEQARRDMESAFGSKGEKQEERLPKAGGEDDGILYLGED